MKKQRFLKILSFVFAVCLFASCFTLLGCNARYNVEVTVESQGAGTIIGIGEYKANKLVTLTADAHIGYVFEGWYQGEDKLSSELDYTVKVKDNVSLTAKFTPVQAMQDFKFSSTKTTCEITGVNNIKAKSFTIPTLVTAIGYRAFYGCTEITSLEIPSTVTNIGFMAFANCSKLKSITVPESVESIGYGAFYDCRELEQATIPSKVTIIEETLFYNCRKLESVEFKGTITSIGKEAFYNCKELVSVPMTEGLVSIGEGAFRGCSTIINFILPASLSTIGARAFYDCVNVKMIMFYDTATWYRTANYVEWKNKTNGEQVDVLVSEANVPGFVNDYSYYWYKID